jgi:hypothetical protein
MQLSKAAGEQFRLESLTKNHCDIPKNPNTKDGVVLMLFVFMVRTVLLAWLRSCTHPVLSC